MGREGTETMMTRAEHVNWAKGRAHEYVQTGDLGSAVSSMISDLGKHPDTENVANGPIGMLGMMEVMNHNRDGVVRWIDGFAA